MFGGNQGWGQGNQQWEMNQNQGWNQGGLQNQAQGGFNNQGGFNQGGFNQGGFNQGGFNNQGTTVYTSTGTGSYNLSFNVTPGVTQVVPGAFYSIWAKHANKVIDISQQEDEQGMAIIYEHKGSPNQKFAFDQVGNGIYQIRSQQTGKLLSIAGNLATDGAQVIEQAPCGMPSQAWQIRPTGGSLGQVMLISYFGKAMDCCEEGIWDGTKVIQYTPQGKANQTWYIRPN